MTYTIAKLTLLPFLRLFIKKVTGIDNLPAKGPFIIAANHESELDPLLLASLVVPRTNEKVRFLAVERLFRNRLRKIIWSRWAGAFPVDKNAVSNAVNILNHNGIIGIFPEGEKREAKLIKAKTGVIRIAAEAKAKIIPVGIIGTSRILPMNERIPRRLGRIAEFNIGKPISVGKIHNKKDLRNAANSIMAAIANLAKKEYKP